MFGLLEAQRFVCFAVVSSAQEGCGGAGILLWLHLEVQDADYIQAHLSRAQSPFAIQKAPEVWCCSCYLGNLPQLRAWRPTGRGDSRVYDHSPRMPDGQIWKSERCCNRLAAVGLPLTRFFTHRKRDFHSERSTVLRAFVCCLLIPSPSKMELGEGGDPWWRSPFVPFSLLWGRLNGIGDPPPHPHSP